MAKRKPTIRQLQNQIKFLKRVRSNKIKSPRRRVVLPQRRNDDIFGDSDRAISNMQHIVDNDFGTGASSEITDFERQVERIRRTRT